MPAIPDHPSRCRRDHPQTRFCSQFRRKVGYKEPGTIPKRHYVPFAAGTNGESKVRVNGESPLVWLSLGERDAGQLERLWEREGDASLLGQGEGIQAERALRHGAIPCPQIALGGIDQVMRA
jgi:hypothetical protein